ncbi:MAG TPA: hypothetical protein VGK73_11170 [Polyangiaceae bacterium]
MRSASRMVWAGLCLVCSWLVACQALLGGYEIDEQGDQTPAAQCSENQFRCVDAMLFCARESDEGEELTLLQRCNSAAECDSTAGRCTVCELGEFRCDGARVERCKADQSGFELVWTCENAGECNVASGECRACNPGETQCAGAEQRDLLQCGSNHLWGPAEPCATKELCADSVVAAQANPSLPAACIPPGCPVAGAYQCGANLLDLERCPADLRGWIKQDECKSPELCQATIADPAGADANGGHCVPPVCEPAGVYRCLPQDTGDTRLESCNAELLGWALEDVCTPPQTCSTNEGICAGPCVPGDFQCNAGNIERCTERRVWDFYQACVTSVLCLISQDENGMNVGTCIEPGCTVPNTYVCEGATLRYCPPDQVAWQDTPCPSDPLCNANDGRCEPIACNPGETRCNPLAPLEHQICKPDLSGWDPDVTCASTQACNAAQGEPACIDVCPEASQRCTGAERQVCTGSTGEPVWTTIATCATQTLCECGLPGGEDCEGGISTVDGVCGQPVCSVGGTRCRDSETQETCESGRNGWVQRDCDISCKTQGMSSYCTECAVGDVECTTGNNMRRCDMNTQRWMNAPACTIACVGASGPDYCAQCRDGDAECVTGGLRTCDGNTLLWGDPSSCSIACVTASGADYCAQCSSGDAECVTGGLRTCNATTRRWNATTMSCSLSCVEPASGPDYCAECATGDARCVSAGLESCDAATKLWADPEACTLSCFDASSGPDYCADCTPNAAECVSSTERRVCNAQARWTTPSEVCDIGCLGTSPDAYCAECDDDLDCTEGVCASGLCQNP